MRRLAVGDIHGNLDAMTRALEAAHFHPQNDHLFFLGDYIDRHSHSMEIVDFILDEVPMKICIRGNHDQYLLDHFNQSGPLRLITDQWKRNGGLRTLESYDIPITSPNAEYFFSSGDIPPRHIEFFETTLPYYITDEGIALGHGGFDLYLKDMSGEYIMWDRSMWRMAQDLEISDANHYPCFNDYPKIFIGHTNLTDFPGQRQCRPRKCLNVWNLDTGAGYAGPLTIMDMDTEEYWQSH